MITANDARTDVHRIPDPDADDDQLPPRHEELTKTCLQCFHIIADLHPLHNGGFIAPQLWRPWQRGGTHIDVKAAKP